MESAPISVAPHVFKPILSSVRADLIANCVVVFIVLIVVSLRVVARLMGPGLGWDDGFVIFATPLGIGMLVCQGLFAPIGNGYTLLENMDLAANIPYILLLVFGMQIIYVVMLAAVKASMLCFYLRIFVTPKVQLLSKITLGFVGVWMIAYIGACVFLCTPVSGQWTGQGTCGAYIPMIQSLIATNAIGDVIIMALPMYSIWTLKTRKTDKVGITACFALGLACVVCAVFRIVYIGTVDLVTNITGTMPTTVFLFILEPNLAILCVSIPMLRPFYVLYKKRMGGSRLDDYTMERSGYRDNSYPSQGSKLRSKQRPGTDAEAISTWEMDEYLPSGKKAEHGVTVTSYGEDSGSEKNLTQPSKGSKDEIRVETRWAISHN